MASCLHSHNSRLLAKSVISWINKLSVDKGICNSGGWRNSMSIAINNEAEFHDVLPVEKSYRPQTEAVDLRTLKMKEKSDWKMLTMEEKKALYQISFSEPFSETMTSTDEWKPILGGTFLAMGLMTMGIYMWYTQFGYLEYSNTSTKNDVHHPDILMNILLDEKVNSAFDSQSRH